MTSGVRDDPTIGDETELWRRISPKQWVHDENIGRFRPTSDLFGDPEASVVIAAECVDGIAGLLKNHDGFGVAALTAGEVRSLQCGVIRDPLPDQPAHAIVTGQKTKSIQRKLAKECRILCEPIISHS